MSRAERNRRRAMRFNTPPRAGVVRLIVAVCLLLAADNSRAAEPPSSAWSSSAWSSSAWSPPPAAGAGPVSIAAGPTLFAPPPAEPAEAAALDRLPAPSAAPLPDSVAAATSPAMPVELLPSPAAAEPQQLPTAEEFAALMKRLDALEKRLAKSADDKAAAGVKPAAEKPKDGSNLTPDVTWTDLSSDKWTVKLGGHLQLDSINWADASPSIPEMNYIEFRRLRLLAEGVGYGVYDFRLQIDIEPESSEVIDAPVVEIKDAYLTAHEFPFLFRQARIGNFFVPFSLEQVTNDTNNIFLERSIPTAGIFTADREVGFAFYGASDDLNTTWTTGLFADNINEGLKERQDDNQGQRISGRLTHLLYYDEPSNGRYLVHTGAGVLFTHDQDNRVRFRARPQIHEGPFLINTGNMAADNYIIGNLELATVWGPWSFQSESFLTNVDLDVGGNTLCWGAYVYGSYFLTGENRIYERFGQHGAQFSRNVPYSNFFWVPGACGPGAWEVKARWSNLSLYEFDKGQYNDFTFGFNWYWSDRIRTMFDWIHPFTTTEALWGETQADIIAMRFDYNF